MSPIEQCAAFITAVNKAVWHQIQQDYQLHKLHSIATFKTLVYNYNQNPILKHDAKVKLKQYFKALKVLNAKLII